MSQTGPRQHADSRALASVTAATITPFSGFVYGCSGTAPEDLRITAGDVLHFIGAGNLNQWASDNPLVDGFEQNEVDANINLKNGVGRVRATATIAPNDINGTWEVRFRVKVGQGATGVGHGTGELEGMTIEFTVGPEADVPNLCNAAHPFRATLQGVIIAPAST